MFASIAMYIIEIFSWEVVVHVGHKHTTEYF